MVALQVLRVAQFYRAPRIAALLPRLRRVLRGVQFHMAGSEGQIGLTACEIMPTGFPHVALQQKQAGAVPPWWAGSDGRRLRQTLRAVGKGAAAKVLATAAKQQRAA